MLHCIVNSCTAIIRTRATAFFLAMPHAHQHAMKAAFPASFERRAVRRLSTLQPRARHASRQMRIALQRMSQVRDTQSAGPMHKGRIVALFSACSRWHGPCSPISLRRSATLSCVSRSEVTREVRCLSLAVTAKRNAIAGGQRKLPPCNTPHVARRPAIAATPRTSRRSLNEQPVRPARAVHALCGAGVRRGHTSICQAGRDHLPQMGTKALQKPKKISSRRKLNENR